MRENKSEIENLKKNAKNVTIVEIAYLFALRIMELAKTLPEKTVSLEIGKELVRSSTSTTANLVEAQAAFSKRDFSLRLNNALKEARKAKLCLRLIRDSRLMDSTKELQDLFHESIGIEKVLNILVETSRKKKIINFIYFI